MNTPLFILGSRFAEKGMNDGIKKFEKTENPLDAIEAVIKKVEADPTVPYVGHGGDPDMLGQMRFDAGIMDGDGLNNGAVAQIKCLHPLSVARCMLEDPQMLHVFLSGEGGDRYADSRGLGQLPPEQMPLNVQKSYDAWCRENVPPELLSTWPNVSPDYDLTQLFSSVNKNVKKKGTVTVSAIAGSHICAGGSTSGWPYRYPGRSGDTPMAGSGFYAINDVGAATVTHAGEVAIRASLASRLLTYLEEDKERNLIHACNKTIDFASRLKGGALGQIVIHAIDAKGNVDVVSTAEESGLVAWFWSSENRNLIEVQPRIISIYTK
jgi:isoaspartyl peptidase/L-asparaginase-like protein (Ntn-hydrolase superfamily)